MRGALFLAAIALVACKKERTPAPALLDPLPEPPAPKELFAAMDGCDAEVYPLRDGTIIVAKNVVARVTEDGLDPVFGEGFAAARARSRYDGWVAGASGSLADTWILLVNHVADLEETYPSRLLHRRDGRWTSIAYDEGAHHELPVAWRGGSLGIVRPSSFSEKKTPHKVIGFDLPPGVDVDKLFPSDAKIWTLGALDTGEVVALTAGGAFLLGADSVVAKPLTLGEEVVGVARSRRGVFDHRGSRSAYHVDGDVLLPEPPPKSPNIDAATRPEMPILRMVPEMRTIRAAFDGEVFTSVMTHALRRSEDARVYGLVRSRRPKEVYRCIDDTTIRPIAPVTETHPPAMRWGMPPPDHGEMFPALDACSGRLTIFDLVDATMLFRSPARLLRVLGNGFDATPQRALAEALAPNGVEHITRVTGRTGDLWVEIAVNYENGPQRILHRQGAAWVDVHPHGVDDLRYYAPEPYRQGAIGWVEPRRGVSGRGRLVGYGLPKDIDVERLFPDAVHTDLDALADGSVVGALERAGEITLWLLRADAKVADRVPGDLGKALHVRMSGRTRDSFRVDGVGLPRRLRFDGDALVVEDGAHRADPKVTRAADGEAFAVVQSTLLRSRRPAEVLHCNETASGIESWPPPADASCATPFVVAYGIEQVTQKPPDLDLPFVAVKTGTRQVIGVRGRSFEDAHRAAHVLEKYGAVELVCADPP